MIINELAAFSFHNIAAAARAARLEKTAKPNVAAFDFWLEARLFELEKRLVERSWRPAPFRSFFIFDPKKRLISAAPFADRVVHHLLCREVEPVFERGFVFESFANRRGKGTHRAVELFQKMARRHPFVLKCDVKKFFPSVDHAILKAEIRRKIKDPDLIWLSETIIDGSNEQEPHVVWFAGDDLFTPLERRRGLPIGNLTSQFWANVYLDRFDHFIKERLGCPGYIRYVDDFVLFADSKEQLQKWKLEIEGFLASLRLLLHPDKTQLYRVIDGVPFLGFTVFPYHKYVRKEKVKRWKRLLRKRLKMRNEGLLPPQKLEDQLNAWLGHVRHGQSKRLEYGVFVKLCEQHGVNLFRSPSGSWRVLEQQSKQLSRSESEQEQYR